MIALGWIDFMRTSLLNTKIKVQRGVQSIALSFVLGWGVCAQAVIAQETRCIGTLGPIETQRIRVPRGRTCVLRGTKVRGNIIVDPHATLKAYNAKVRGRVISRSPQLIRLDQKTIVDRITTEIF